MVARRLATGLTLMSVALLLIASSGSAQSTETNPPARLAMLLRQNGAKSLWRFRTTAGTECQGRARDIDSSAVLFEDGCRVAWHDIEHAWKRGPSGLKGGVIGAVVVGAAGGLWLGNDCATEGAEIGCAPLPVFALGAALGGAGGFLLGAAIGSLIPGWHSRYP